MEELRTLDFSFALEEPVHNQIRNLILENYKIFHRTRKPQVFAIGTVESNILYNLIGEIAANNEKALECIKINADLIMIGIPNDLNKMRGMTGKDIEKCGFEVFSGFRIRSGKYDMKSR
jgi:hypothetical protein